MFGRIVILSAPVWLLVFVVAASAQPADEAAAKENEAAPLTSAQLYPLAQDAEWHYTMHTEKGDAEMSYQVAKLESEADQEAYRVEMVLDKKIVLTEQLNQTPEGLFRTQLQDAKLSPPLLLLKNPVKSGEQWRTKTQIGAQELTIECQVESERVSVPAGEYDAVKLTVSTQANESDIRSTYWFAAGVGIVRQEAKIGDEPTMSIELTSYQPGPSAAPNNQVSAE